MRGAVGECGETRAVIGRSPPTVVLVTANRDELIHLIEGMPDDQIDVLLARRLSLSEPQRTWPPSSVGMIKDGPDDGSSPECIDSVPAR